MQNADKTLEGILDGLRDRKLSEVGLIRGVIIDPLQFELWQKEVRSTLALAQGIDKMIEDLDKSPDILINRMEKLGGMGKALTAIIEEYLAEAEGDVKESTETLINK